MQPLRISKDYKARTKVNELDKIIKGCISKDQNAQKQMFLMFGNKMLGICARYCKDIEDARDAMQDGFVKVFTKIDSFKGDSKFETWLTKIMVYTAIDNFKKNSKQFSFDPTQALLISDASEEMEIEFENSPSLKDRLMCCLEELPGGYRTIFNLYVIDGFTHSEIAEELNISIGTSKSQLARARKLLQTIVKEKLGIEQGTEAY